MYYGGFPLKMVLWCGFCDKHDIRLIESAAHAAGPDRLLVIVGIDMDMTFNCSSAITDWVRFEQQ